MPDSDARRPQGQLALLIALAAVVALAVSLFVRRRADEAPSSRAEEGRTGPGDTERPSAARLDPATQPAALPPVPVASPAASRQDLLGRLRVAGTLEAVSAADVWLALETEPERRAGTAARSDGEGMFRLVATQADRAGVLYVAAPGRRFWSAPLASLPEVDGVHDVLLPAGGEIRGVVVDPADRPIPGVRVQARGEHAEDVAWATEPTGWGGDQVPDLADGESDATGAFVLSGLGSHEYELHARKAGFTGPSPGAPRPTARPVEGRGPGVRLVLHPLYEARVAAVDEITGRPVPSASISVSTFENEPWAYGGTPAARAADRDEEPGEEDAVGSGRATVYRAGDGDLRTPVRFIVRSPGYAEQSLDVTPVPVGRAVVHVMEMRRATSAPLAPIRFRLVLGKSTDGPSGLFSCRLSDAPQMARAPQFDVRFESGMATEPVHLPRGPYRVVLRGAAGSTLLWHDPLGPRPHPFEVRDESAAVVDLPCAGSFVCVRPKPAAGNPLREFRLSLETPHYSGDVSTWEYDLARDSCAEDGAQPAFGFWLPAGKCSLWVGKRGYATAATELDVPRDGARLTWEPVLPRAGEK
jgi:hypothetical protein